MNTESTSPSHTAYISEDPDVLSPHYDTFKATVLEHIEKKLPPEEWARFREIAMTRRHFSAGVAFNPNAQAAELIDTYTSEDGVSINESIPAGLHTEIIATIAGKPLYFIPKRGIYTWSLDLNMRPCFSFWLTSPAYPPGW